MAVYQDSEGNRYWIDGEPEPGVHRDDLVLVEEVEPPVSPEESAE